MPGKDQILLQILVPSTFIKRTGRDHLVAFGTNMLFEEKIAVEGEEGDFGAAAEHDYARDIIDSGALYAIRIYYTSRLRIETYTSTGAPVAMTLIRSNRFRSHKMT